MTRAVSNADLLAKVESELNSHMDDAGVPPEVQKLVYVKGFTSMRLFAGVDETRGEVRAALKDLLPLDYSADATSRHCYLCGRRVGCNCQCMRRTRQSPSLECNPGWSKLQSTRP